jgi:hypothetical protein
MESIHKLKFLVDMRLTFNKQAKTGVSFDLHGEKQSTNDARPAPTPNFFMKIMGVDLVQPPNRSVNGSNNYLSQPKALFQQKRQLRPNNSVFS